MSQENEPALLEYARFYGLAVDHQKVSPLAYVDEPQDYIDQLEDPPGVLDLNGLDVRLTTEKITIEESALRYLHDVLSLPDKSLGLEENDGFDVHRVRNLKQDLPLIHTDHALDMLGFAPHDPPDLACEFFPPEKVEEEADEALNWASSHHALSEEFAHRVGAEKLVVSNEALLSLRDALKSQSEGKTPPSFDFEEPSYRRNRALDRLTPPISPLVAPFQPYVPSSDTCHVELLSECTSPIHEEIAELEQQIGRSQTIVPQKRRRGTSSGDADPVLFDMHKIGDIYSPLSDIQHLPSSPPIKRAPLQNRKVDVPLTPPTIECPVPCGVESILGSGIITELPSPFPQPENILSEDVDVFLTEHLGPFARNAERAVEQEQLTDTHGARRVPVPIMDFARPLAPWNSFTKSNLVKDDQNYHRELREALGKIDLGKRSWSGVGNADQDLKWMPFPSSLGKHQEHESISDNELLSKIHSWPEVVDSSTLTWKPEGLRILDKLGDSDDEELQVASFGEMSDLDFFIRRRYLELGEGNDEHATDAAEGLRSGRQALVEDIDATQGMKTKEDDRSLTSNDTFDVPKESSLENLSTFNAVEKFMYVRKGLSHKPKTTGNNSLPSQKSTLLSNAPQTDTTVSRKVEVQEGRTTVPTSPWPKPILSVPTIPHAFIVSSTFFHNRKLVRQIQKLYPTAEFFERGLTVSATANMASSLIQPLRVNHDAVVSEADMIVSPGTGLIWTTMQRIKQTSLPGTYIRSVIHQRVEQAAPLYERMVVLVSLDNEVQSSDELTTQENPRLVDKDYKAFAEFTAFCSSLETECHTMLVPGGEEQLAQWIVAMMSNNGYANSAAVLRDEETAWEHFLNEAGANNYASQAILFFMGDLQQASQSSPEALEHALALFVQMTLEERLEMFEGMMGGRELITRISKALDAKR